MSFNPSQPRVAAGQAGGGRWGGAGAPRSAQAATAQSNKTAQKHYTAVRGLPPGRQRVDYVKGLSDADLEALTAILYSSRTSDPDVVNARIVVANEMKKRGLDIKKYGALGGGGVAAHQAVKKAAARRAAVQHVLAQHRHHVPPQPTKAYRKSK